MPNYSESISDFTNAFYNKAGAKTKLPDTYLQNPSDAEWLGDRKTVIQTNPLPADYWTKFYQDTTVDNSALAPPSSSGAPVPRSRPAWLRAIIGEPKMDPVPDPDNDRGWSQFEDWRDDPANGSFGGVPVTIHGGNVDAPIPRNRPFSFFRRNQQQKPRSKVDAAPAPSTFKGTSTKNTYTAGKTYMTKDGRQLRANADGTFTNVVTGRRSTGSSVALGGSKPFWQQVQENGG